MKKTIVLLIVLGMGAGAYWGYYAMQRHKINEIVKYLCMPRETDDLDEMQHRKKLCPFWEEVAASSKTVAEFDNKFFNLVRFDNRVKPIIEEHKKRKEQREQ